VPHTSTVQRLSQRFEGVLVNAMAATGLELAMPPKKAAGFPRTSRLLRHADFERVYKEGRRHFSASMTFFYLVRPQAEIHTRAAAHVPEFGLRVGFTVGRALGGAVVRNRMKRRLREAVRLSRPAENVAADVVINPKKSLLAADFTAVLNEVSRAFVVIEQKLSKPANSPVAQINRKPEAGSRS
jgi:ribonuclease P protein component